MDGEDGVADKEIESALDGGDAGDDNTLGGEVTGDERLVVALSAQQKAIAQNLTGRVRRARRAASLR